MTNIKKTIHAKRVYADGYWQEAKKYGGIRACGDTVDELFFGVSHSKEIDFELTTRRPRDGDYHCFDWDGICYATRPEEVRGNIRYSILASTSGVIHRRMKRAKTIYIAAWG